ncbi:bifunctional ADP-dependent NAD(P)H-hydrate dehydratase/NAD(P)H-hydrate epimerase [Vibrio rhizosphaerae]|uniref:Bifunctional NAD(P)H-hydrate repair enzyme n=1 Tax=Vibrio rhizosphaerae TaxID=398736 RepID=A0ABU4IZE8_9VIBR|nr:bifunctional ADP-dependent NAD(P)H-hydrate dehydratase/NAD(P)H-hydrate epimerase [Vibrio rhizosphaerae]MDW6094720.1 bifunctional ADP-dependent NAD(P)H-hydrate dehydratase/NAD(P)H-hydrate epimerase [Vibrio rhizosphaerae]
MTMTNVFYSTQQVRIGEQKAASAKGLEMYSLMERAGQAVFAIGMAQYPSSEHWLICCGGGNNGGDGYIVASLAKSIGLYVTVWQVGDPETLTGDARMAYEHWQNHGGNVSEPQERVPDSVDVVIDALLGTGLSGPVRPGMLSLIETLNQSMKPVIAVDIPSGLCGDTGSVLGGAIIAQHTVSFIGLKQGLVTGKAREYVGELHFAGLGVEDAFDQQNHPTVMAIHTKMPGQMLPKRFATSHKGTHGKALLIGGNDGMGGAIILSAMAAARCGTGMTAVLCHPHNVTPLLVSAPEVMSACWDKSQAIERRLHWCDVLAVGPGLGRDETAFAIYQAVQSIAKPKVVDADGLYFLMQQPNQDPLRVITPHPAEAAQLLQVSVEEIEADRYASVQALHRQYGGVVVLKGAGTLVYDGEQISVCMAGNPGMASAGMGDVLTGVITSLIAQGLPLVEATQLGVLIHSMAADQNSESYGERGLLASDLLPHLRQLVNH